MRTGFVQPGEEKVWWGIKLWSSRFSWHDLGCPRCSSVGIKVVYICRCCILVFNHTGVTCTNWDTWQSHFRFESKLRGKEQPLSEQTVCRILPLGSHCIVICLYLEGRQMLMSTPLCQRQEAVIFFFTILSRNFRTSQLIFVSRDSVHHSSSIPILKLDWLIWCCAEWRHLGWSGMSSYCAVVLPSPILENVFRLEGLKNHGIARSRNSDRGQTSQLVNPI